jgi:hypothetical protein
VRAVIAHALAALAVVATSSPAHADDLRIAFPFHDDVLLRDGQAGGGLTFVPEAVAEGHAAPLVVFLHGVNREATLHAWLGGRGVPDLTSVASTLAREGRAQPFIFAGPSETRDARAGVRMWRDFDLDELVDAVDASLEGRAVVARDKVIVAGHSGAACNPDGGLLRAASVPGHVVPAAILAIDTCLDADAGRAFGAASPEVPVYVRWERVVWPRPLGLFLDTFATTAASTGRPSAFIEELTGFGKRPHDEIVERALNELLPKLLPPSKGET